MGDGFAEARVAAARRLAPGIRQISIATGSLALANVYGGADVAVRFPGDDGRRDERHYSVWRTDGSGTLDICVVLHGLGPGSRWAERCEPGDAVEISVARTLPIDLSPAAEEHIFLGDETSIAGCDALMRALPPGVPRRACFEIEAPALQWPDSELVNPDSITWIPRQGRPGLALSEWLVGALQPAAPGAAAYVTGETWLCSTVSSRLVRELGFARESVRALPFWKKRAPGDAMTGAFKPILEAK